MRVDDSLAAKGENDPYTLNKIMQCMADKINVLFVKVSGRRQRDASLSYLFGNRIWKSLTVGRKTAHLWESRPCMNILLFELFKNNISVCCNDVFQQDGWVTIIASAIWLFTDQFDSWDASQPLLIPAKNLPLQFDKFFNPFHLSKRQRGGEVGNCILIANHVRPEYSL